MQNDKNPFMPFVEDFEAEAEAFLRKYCKEVLDSPQATPIRDIAQKQMNLDIVETESLSPDDSIQGAIAFTAGIIEVYDWSSEEYIGYEVTQPTVFLDSDILNPGRANNTLAHECYHWYKHRAYFRYQNVQKLGSEFAFRCLITGQHDRNEQWSDIEKMEWQARTIAPKILMPRCTVKMLLSERLDNIQSRNVQSSVLKAVVEEVAETYKVSKQSAAIRVSELGFTQAVELYDSETVVIDRRHRKSSTAAKFHQQPIDEVSAFRLYMNNEFLKATLDTGAFCFAEGYFVLRDEKYVLPGEDALFLTEYARLHLSECTLDFSYKLVCSRTSVRDVHYMFRADIEYKKLPSYDSNTQNMDEYNKAIAKVLDDVDTEFQTLLNRNRLVNETTSQRMCKYMDAAHWNTSIFQSKTLLAPMDYTRVYQNHKFKVPSYTAMAVGLKLTLHETEEALRFSGLGYDNSDDTDCAYMYILSAFHGYPIDECNVVLEKLNVKPLGTKPKK